MKKLIVSRLAILLCAFCLFGVMTVCHAEQGGYPHPEKSARASRTESGRHADYASGPDRRSE